MMKISSWQCLCLGTIKATLRLSIFINILIFLTVVKMTRVSARLAVHLAPLEVTTMTKMPHLRNRCMMSILDWRMSSQQLHNQLLQCLSTAPKDIKTCMTSILVKNLALILMMTKITCTCQLMVSISGWMIVIRVPNLSLGLFH